jgi:hypothetical protein
MKAFSNHSVGISRSQERCSVKLESAAISSRGPGDGPPLVSYIFVPTRLTVRVSSGSSDTVTKPGSTKL